MKRYEALAEEIARSIRDGLLRPGDRLPSVREASRHRAVSPATVFQAYYRLEAQGLVRSRERSGYYVTRSAAKALAAPPEPEMRVPPPSESTELDVSELVFEVLESAMSRDLVPLGSAFPSPELFPLARLGRSMASSVQQLDPWSSVDDLTPGFSRLRRQIALRYLVDGMHVPADDIVITNGALEALNLCLAAVTRPGDAVVVESPTFYAALQALERNHLRAIEVATHPREGIDLAALAEVLERHRPKACWLMTSFQNPLGSSMPDAKKQALVELLARFEVPLIEDDVYAELYHGTSRHLPAKAWDRHGLVMHCSSFSKCLAPGYRVGWVAPGRYRQAVARLKLTTSLTTSAPAQHAIAAWLEKGGFDRHLRRLRRTLADQQATFLELLTRHFPAGCRVTRPSGGYFVWVELPPGVDALELHRRALSHGISIAPGPIFSAHRGFANGIRLNYGHTADPRTGPALATLGKLIASAM
ncbi:PLP-dependent aminotransferase family protein [Montanilutibacter psychrotolerans]|uniref:PLP-dependent aminotransferase family protein n=1 Tax=Montanilutibacter psychrotolerans TaxID=1327343 RepID=A0A3M8SWC6_9GAMM|nr:PLP-dependent aminotransferase family protein [Lysobacter psychrotolerans]RNF85123.1 PLP-dependent aminotransferase family protein [Lysobacter psychrotolerans]